MVDDSEAPSPHEARAVAWLLAAWLVGLAMIPFHYRLMVLGEDGPLASSLVIALAVAVLLGGCLRASGLGQGIGLALSSAGIFWVATLALTLLLADIASGAGVAMAAGLTASCLAAAGAVALVRWVDPLDSRFAGGVLALVALGVYATLAGQLHERVAQGEEDAARVRELDASGLTPYRVELEGWQAEFADVIVEDGDVVGYELWLDKGAGVAPDRFTVRATSTAPSCADVESAGGSCVEGDGYVVVTDGSSGRRTVQSAESSSTVLAVELDGLYADDVPPIEEVGAMLADAEPSTWREVVTQR